MAIDLRETPILWTVGEVIPKMPFAEHSGMVTIILEELAKRNFIFPQHGPTVHCVPDPGTVGPVSGKQATTGRRAGRGYVVVI
jgi:hypothetical protein